MSEQGSLFPNQPHQASGEVTDEVIAAIAEAGDRRNRESLPVVQGGEGARGDFTDATSGEFGFGLPEPDTPEHAAMRHGIGKWRAALHGTSVPEVDPGETIESFTLPGLEEPTVVAESESKPKVDLTRRNAFGRVPKPEYFGIAPDAFDDVTAEERAAADANRRFRPRLYGVAGGESLNGLALSSSEYEAIVRYPGGFVTAIAAKTDAARGLDHDRERRDASVQRSVEHAAISKQDRAGKVIEGLEAEEAALRSLLKEMRSPGFAHMSEADMRMLATTARSSFDNILSVVGSQAGWTPDQRVRADKAMNARLFDTDYKKAFSYWKELTTLAAEYTHSKIGLFRRQARAVARQSAASQQ